MVAISPYIMNWSKGRIVSKRFWVAFLSYNRGSLERMYLSIPVPIWLAWSALNASSYRVHSKASSVYDVDSSLYYFQESLAFDSHIFFASWTRACRCCPICRCFHGPRARYWLSLSQPRVWHSFFIYSKESVSVNFKFDLKSRAYDISSLNCAQRVRGLRLDKQWCCV